jgi:hypothetical protein
MGSATVLYIFPFPFTNRFGSAHVLFAPRCRRAVRYQL